MTTRRRGTTERAEHKLEQLCAEVEEVLSLALGAAADTRLQDLTVRAVAPGPGGKLVVTVVADDVPDGDLDALEKLQEAIEHAGPWLRQQVAAEVNRKRAPDLGFRVVPPWDLPV